MDTTTRILVAVARVDLAITILGPVILRAAFGAFLATSVWCLIRRISHRSFRRGRKPGSR